MWTVVYIAPNRKQAERLQKALSQEGLLVKLRNIGLPNGNDNGSVEILVPESELDEALEIINTI
ncbi:glutamate decarboxylase [Desulfotomaculum sp. 1211_IL3151]|uniref:glutamate decarboxylase n=1 Tax=Desulfotomaculum sp. 1211_IL3151 TaxID=3084055 RepID=UPI002FD88C82